MKTLFTITLLGMLAFGQSGCSAGVQLRPSASGKTPTESALRAHWTQVHDEVLYWEVWYALVCDSDHTLVATIKNNGRDDIWHTPLEPSPVEGFEFAKHQIEIEALQTHVCPEAK